MIHRASVVGLLVLALAGCSGQSGPDSSSIPQPLRPHEFALAGKPTKQLGEDCTFAGKSECHSEVCVHVRPEPDKGYVCAKTCDMTGRGECPKNWMCLQTHPSEKKGLCLPPTGWSPKVAN